MAAPDMAAGEDMQAGAVNSVTSNYYELLSVEPTAQLADIRDSYKRIVLKIHPDRALQEKKRESQNQKRKTKTGSGQQEQDDAENENADQAGGGGHSPEKGRKGDDEGLLPPAADSDAQQEAGKQDAEAEEEEAQLEPPSKEEYHSNLERFYQVQDPWKTLSNPSRRFLYDMRTFGHSYEFPEEEENYLLELEKAQAEKDLHSMRDYLHKVIRRERKAKGIIILDAWYGDMGVLGGFSILGGCSQGFQGSHSAPTPSSQDGLYTCVRVATQCQVDYRQHRLVMSGGVGTSRADIPGFYNPIPLSLRKNKGMKKDGVEGKTKKADENGKNAEAKEDEEKDEATSDSDKKGSPSKDHLGAGQQAFCAERDNPDGPEGDGAGAEKDTAKKETENKKTNIEVGIFIRYQFGDEVHEVLANDTEPVYIPKRAHSITNIAARLAKEEDIEAANGPAAKSGSGKGLAAGKKDGKALGKKDGMQLRRRNVIADDDMVALLGAVVARSFRISAQLCRGVTLAFARSVRGIAGLPLTMPLEVGNLVAISLGLDRYGRNRKRILGFAGLNQRNCPYLVGLADDADDDTACAQERKELLRRASAMQKGNGRGKGKSAFDLINDSGSSARAFASANPEVLALLGTIGFAGVATWAIAAASVRNGAASAASSSGSSASMSAAAAAGGAMANAAGKLAAGGASGVANSSGAAGASGASMSEVFDAWNRQVQVGLGMSDGTDGSLQNWSDVGVSALKTGVSATAAAARYAKDSQLGQKIGETDFGQVSGRVISEVQNSELAGSVTSTAGRVAMGCWDFAVKNVMKPGAGSGGAQG